MKTNVPSNSNNASYQKTCDYIQSKVRSIPDWPIKGVIFRDITTLLQDTKAFKDICAIFHSRYVNEKIDKIVAIDARGFLFGAVVAYNLEIGLIPIRKKGKLPYTTIGESYSLEYGEATVEIHAEPPRKSAGVENAGRVERLLDPSLQPEGGRRGAPRVEQVVRDRRRLGHDHRTGHALCPPT